MRGIARTDGLVRLVMWGALLAAAWILFSPGKASASEHPVQQVVRSTTSLTGAVLDDVAPSATADSSATSGTSRQPALSKPATTLSTAVRDLPKALAHRDSRGGRPSALPSLRQPLNAPVASTAASLEPVVPPTARTVRAAVASTVERVDATTEPLPVLAPSVRGVAALADDVLEALPLIGTTPVIELPLPGLPPATGASPSTSLPAALAADAPTRLPAGPGDERAAAAGSRVGALRPVVDVIADAVPTDPLAVGLPGHPHVVAAAGAGAPGMSAPSRQQPWPHRPNPAAPLPAPASAGSSGPLLGADLPAVLPSSPSSGSGATGACASDDDRAPCALNAQPGLRPD